MNPEDAVSPFLCYTVTNEVYGGFMAIFTVELESSLVKRFKADSFSDNGDMIYFYDRENRTVGSVVKKPGMTVTQEGHDADED